MTENPDLYKTFSEMTIADLQELLMGSQTREEAVFYRKLINMKLQINQEKIVGEALL